MTTLYPVVGPEPQGPAELDLPDRDARDGYAQLAHALSRAGDQRLAIDTPSSLDLRRLSTAELRAERDRLRGLLDQAPRDRSRELERASARRAEADQTLEQLTANNELPRQGRGMLRLRWRVEQAGAGPAVVAVARQQADRAHTTELQLRRQQQRRAGWLEANAHLGPTYRQVLRELAWQRRAAGLAAEHDPPGYLREELGPVPESTRGRRAWRQAAATIEDYRHTYGITDPEQALGPVPREPVRRAAWQHARTAAQRTKDRQRTPNRQERTAATRPAPATAAIPTLPTPETSRRQHADAAPSGPPASNSEGASDGQAPPHPARPRPGRHLAVL
jgi:hypothetical protein